MAYDNLTLPRETLIGDEQAVIGAMLIDAETVGIVVESLSDADFTMEIHRTLFRAFRRLYLDSRIIDPVTVLGELGMGEDAAIRRYVMDLMDVTPTAANIKEYIAEVRENSRKVRLRAIGERLAKLTSLDDALPLLGQGMELLSEEGREDEADMAKSALDFYEDLERTPEYFRWGFYFLDENLLAERGHLAIVAGRPSDGKTSLALHMAYAQAKKYNVGFFSCETGKKSLYTRLVSSVSGVPNKAIRRRNLSEREYRLIASGTYSTASHRLTFVESTAWTVEKIEARALARKFDVIYIDYLQLISPSSKRSSRQDDVADISRALANVARKHKILVVAISQLSRQETKGHRREPVMADLRESGQIEQDADEIMFIWRKDETSSNAERILTLAKNKEGPLGTWPLVFNGALHRFVDELGEPEPQQITFDNQLRNLSPDTETPFDKEEKHDSNPKQSPPPAGGGDPPASGNGADGGAGAGGGASGDGAGPGTGAEPGKNLPF